MMITFYSENELLRLILLEELRIIM